MKLSPYDLDICADLTCPHCQEKVQVKLELDEIYVTELWEYGQPYYRKYLDVRCPVCSKLIDIEWDY